MKFNQLSNEVKTLIFIFGFITLIIGGTIILGIANNNKIYNAMKNDIANGRWINAKAKLETLGNYKDSQNFSDEIYYNYYILIGDNLNQEKQYQGALSNYKKAYQLNSKDENLVQKIEKMEKILQKLKEEEEKAKKLKLQQEELKRKQEEVARLKAEKEEKLKIQRMLDNVVILSQYFGYTQYGEYGVVGKIKNNNSFLVQVRADIDLKDYNGNVIDTTYTYDRIAPHSIWNFEAPIFGNVTPNHSYIHLTIERLD